LLFARTHPTPELPRSFSSHHTPRTMALITAQQYIQAFVVVMAVYAAQMLLVPAKMVTDHFKAPATPMVQFWIRGASVAWGGLAYCVYTMPTAAALPVATAASVACNVLYPMNAKFGLIGAKKLPVKYPMHYVRHVTFQRVVESESIDRPRFAFRRRAAAATSPRWLHGVRRARADSSVTRNSIE